MIESRLLGVLSLMAAAFSTTTAIGHPHHHVEQQAHLTLDDTEVQVVLRIVPSVEDGAAIFDAIDRDRNGTVTTAEAARLADELLDASDLRWDGERLQLQGSTTSVPQRELLSRGHGTIVVRSRASLEPRPGRQGREHRLDFQITARRFARLWFVQPFYTRSLLQQTTSRRVERRSDGEITIHLTRAPQKPSALAPARTAPPRTGV